ncbi:ATP-binding cassette domain-containing protein [Pseudomonas aeruginosa]|nr:ATP-binding cassette domain-containing protein [Pseudomonas aeruginosa]UJT96841.1 ATP-binding cassette domain-containing protein [Pseudomonas aeruginosa]
MLAEIDLQLFGGEVLALTGENGAGKSTLLRIAAGLDDDFQGTVERNPILGFGPDGENGRSGGIGVVFQEPRLLPWLTVAQNVGFADGLSRFSARDARAVPDFIYELFPVLREMKQRRGGDLSGGQQ